jgi:hypothetical protein
MKLWIWVAGGSRILSRPPVAPTELAVSHNTEYTHAIGKEMMGVPINPQVGRIPDAS